MLDLKRMLNSLVLIGFGLVLLWQNVDGVSRNRRLDANPHSRATVERTWTTSGKNSARYADLRFPGPIGVGLCHASSVRLGPSGVAAQQGQTIDIVPIPGSCAAPDAPTARPPAYMINFQFAAAFVAFICGVRMLLGLLPRGRTAPTGFARRFG